jgi:hypothetical protein
MRGKDRFSEYPCEIRVSTERPELRFVRLPGHFAVPGPVPPAWAAQVVLLLDDGKVAVCRGEPGDQPAGDLAPARCPVYALGHGGPPVVPTGLVFVRFREGVRVEERSGALAAAGYALKQIPSFAPHAAWVEAASGGIAEALTGIPRLEALLDVINVEPQMLSERVRR